jgi:8-oxo-dGTP pyrophosphatase MutT (NUDIX family)
VITFDLGRGRFNYRVAAVIEHDGHVLVCRETDGDFWFLPGGRCEFMEPSHEAVKRELREEFGVECRVERLLWIVENFFLLTGNSSGAGKTFHEIGLYFLVSLPPQSPLLDKAGRISFDDGMVNLEARWFPLSEVGSINLVPLFLRIGLLDLPSTPQQVINDEIGR